MCIYVPKYGDINWFYRQYKYICIYNFTQTRTSTHKRARTHAHMQPDEDLNRAKPVVAIGMSRAYIIHILFILCTNILLFHFRLNFYWWILGRSVRHKAWFCFNHIVSCLYLDYPLSDYFRKWIFSFIISNYSGN